MDTYQFSQVHPATAVAYSPGSTFIATALAGSVSIRLTSSLDCVRTWACHAPETTSRWTIDSLQWSTNGSRVLAHSSKLGSAWAFDLTSEEAICRLSGVPKVEWGGDDVVSFTDRGMGVHSLTTGNSRFIQSVQNAHSWSPDYRYLAVVERHQGKDYLGVYDKEALVRHFAVPLAETAGVSWSPCGKWLAVWDWHLAYSLYVYSPVGAELGHFEPTDVDIPGGILHVVWSPNGRFLMIGDTEGTVRIVESESWTPLATFHISESPAWREASSTARQGPKLTQFTRSTMPAVKRPIDLLQFNPDGTLLLVGNGNIIQIYSFQDDISSNPRIEVYSSIVFNNPIKVARWCSSPDRLAVVTQSQTLYLWDLLGVEGVDVPEAQDFVASDVVWSPDGRSAAICSKQSFCVVYDEAPDTANAWEEVP